MKKEYNLKKMKRRPSKSSKEIKVIKTIRLDVEIFEWLQEKAKKEGLPYQTYLNQLLHKAMKNEHEWLSQTDRLEELIGRLEKMTT